MEEQNIRPLQRQRLHQTPQRISADKNQRGRPVRKGIPQRHQTRHALKIRQESQPPRRRGRRHLPLTDTTQFA
jgi:hypothetical protein